MSTEMTLADQMAYAQAVVVTPERGQSLLPQAYRNNPAAVLIAMGLGQALDLTPAQALYEIYVVNGRPSPSANLMAGLVRRAGHKLRIEGDASRCTATLIRKDDPEAPFTATWTIEQARAAGLTGKGTWKAYPAAMLRARAISEVVRMGSSESVLGMDYSAEEMRDVDQAEPAAAAKPRGMDAVRQAVAQPTEQAGKNAQPAEDVQDADVVDEADRTLTEHTRKKMFALLSEVDPGSTAETQRAGMSLVLGRPIKSRTELTEDDALMVIDALNVEKRKRAIAAEQEPAEGGQE